MAREVSRFGLKDGFYIEVCSPGSKQGIKIACETREDMMKQNEMYKQNKYVILWGQHRDGKWIEEKILPVIAARPMPGKHRGLK